MKHTKQSPTHNVAVTTSFDVCGRVPGQPLPFLVSALMDLEPGVILRAEGRLGVFVFYRDDYSQWNVSAGDRSGIYTDLEIYKLLTESDLTEIEFISAQRDSILQTNHAEREREFPASLLRNKRELQSRLAELPIGCKVSWVGGPRGYSAIKSRSANWALVDSSLKPLEDCDVRAWWYAAHGVVNPFHDLVRSEYCINNAQLAKILVRSDVNLALHTL